MHIVFRKSRYVGVEELSLYHKRYTLHHQNNAALRTGCCDMNHLPVGGKVDRSHGESLTNNDVRRKRSKEAPELNPGSPVYQHR